MGDSIAVRQGMGQAVNPANSSWICGYSAKKLIFGGESDEKIENA